MLLVLIYSSLLFASEIIILAPIDGSSVKSSEIILIGKASEKVKEVEIKGATGDVKVPVKNGGFFTKIKLPGVENKLTFTADDGSTAEMNIKVNNSDNFNYHPDESEVTDCASTCHNESDTKGYAVQPAAGICYECHDVNNEKAFVHGPVNMGICVVCHMPHGSSNNPGFLLTSKEAICQGCHDELMSSHPDSKNKICVDCHDPHSSDNEFHMK